MKKIQNKLILVCVLAMLFSTVAFGDISVTKSKSVNVDNMLRNIINFNSSDLSLVSMNTAVDMPDGTGGEGTFWVSFFTQSGSQAFSSNYYHHTRVHKSSCTNAITSSSSGWVDPRITAYSWLYTTFSGNRANYDWK